MSPVALMAAALLHGAGPAAPEDSASAYLVAARRLYAKIMRERFHARNPRSTSGAFRMIAAGRRFLRNRLSGLVSQMRRAASSIPSNIAEGCGRDGDAELSRFCVMARGSASELEYQLLLSRDLKLIQSQEYEQLTQQTVEIKRMLTVLVQKLNAES